MNGEEESLWMPVKTDILIYVVSLDVLGLRL